MKKFLYCFMSILFLFPITTLAASDSPQSSSIEISYINVTLNGQNINSGVVEVTPGQQLQLHVVFNYYGGKITNYPATQLRLDDGSFNGEVQAQMNHFEKITETQAAEDVTIAISSNAKPGDVIPVKFIIEGPDINSEEGETITFVIKDSSTDTTDTTSSSESSSESSSSESSSSESSSSESSSSESSSSESSSSESSSSESSSSESSSSESSSSESSSSESSSSESSSSESTVSSTDGSTAPKTGKTTTSSSKYDTVKSKRIDANDSKTNLVSIASNSSTPTKKSAVYLKHLTNLLPKTGMEKSALGWFGFGVLNFAAAIYLFRKK